MTREARAIDAIALASRVGENEEVESCTVEFGVIVDTSGMNLVDGLSMVKNIRHVDINSLCNS